MHIFKCCKLTDALPWLVKEHSRRRIWDFKRNDVKQSSEELPHCKLVDVMPFSVNPALHLQTGVFVTFLYLALSWHLGWQTKDGFIAKRKSMLHNVLYGCANDPWTANDPGPQMIPKLNRKWSRTENDPHIGPQMIPIKKIRNGMDLYQRKVRTCTKIMN